ncbi:MAG: IS256 family transposase [Firmicutes bacterium]|nr:IS256 family transposase [Bacillota bacterium]
MNDFTTELVKTLVEGKDIKEIFRFHIEKAVNQLLQIELREFLNYDKYDRRGFNTGNSRNGTYDRILKTEYGELNLTMPRDRNGAFENQTIPPYKRQNDTLESMIIYLYSNGITTDEIARMIEKMYGHHYTKQTISNITAQVIGDVQAFNHRSLNKRYAVIYLDATYLPVRRDTVSKEALFFALGITPEGYKEILSYSLFPTESAHNWEIVLSDLRARGVEETLLFVTDGLTGIRDAISNVYPNAKHQSCWVHLARNVAHSVRVKDRGEVLMDLKKVYTQNTLETAENALDEFIHNWEKRYPKVTERFKNNPSLFTFLSFPKPIRASIYTTNLIENLNKHLKRYTKRKEQFPNEDSLLRFMISYAEDYNQKFQMRIHKGFSLVTAELNEMFN